MTLARLKKIGKSLHGLHSIDRSNPPNPKHASLGWREWWHTADRESENHSQCDRERIGITSCVVGRGRQKHTFVQLVVRLSDSLRKSPPKIWSSLSSCVCAYVQSEEWRRFGAELVHILDRSEQAKFTLCYVWNNSVHIQEKRGNKLEKQAVYVEHSGGGFICFDFGLILMTLEDGGSSYPGKEGCSQGRQGVAWNKQIAHWADESDWIKFRVHKWSLHSNSLWQQLLLSSSLWTWSQQHKITLNCNNTPKY